MPVETMTHGEFGDCPICLARIAGTNANGGRDVFPCPVCRSMIIVRRRNGHHLVLAEAPGTEGAWDEATP